MGKPSWIITQAECEFGCERQILKIQMPGWERTPYYFHCRSCGKQNRLEAVAVVLEIGCKTPPPEAVKAIEINVWVALQRKQQNRKLIRSMLLMIARLGLFLAVVAWAFGQWFYFASEMNLPAVHLHVLNAADGIEVTVDDPFYWPVDAEWELTTGRYGKSPFEFFRDSENPPVGPAQSWVAGIVPGQITILNHRDNPTGFIVHHYLVLTICAMFYGVLMLIYRKR